MRAYVVKEWKHPSKLALVQDAPEPVPGPEDVLVDVHAAGLNFFDVGTSPSRNVGTRLSTFLIDFASTR